MYEKWEICNVVLEGIIHETRATLECMCCGGFSSLNVYDMWNLFESLAFYQWQYKCASESFMYPSPPPYDLHAQSPCVYQFRDAYDHDSSYPHDVCSYCQSFNHDANFCPYYDISDESYARLNSIIDIMNELHEHFVSEMREFGLLHEIDPCLPIPRLESDFYDDYKSSLPL